LALTETNLFSTLPFQVFMTPVFFLLLYVSKSHQHINIKEGEWENYYVHDVVQAHHSHGCCQSHRLSLISKLLMVECHRHYASTHRHRHTCRQTHRHTERQTHRLSLISKLLITECHRHYASTHRQRHVDRHTEIQTVIHIKAESRTPLNFVFQ